MKLIQLRNAWVNNLCCNCNMTIEKKANELYYVPKHLVCQEALDEVIVQKVAFTEGAEWMLQRATQWLKNQGAKSNNGVVMISIDDFKKAMED